MHGQQSGVIQQGTSLDRANQLSPVSVALAALIFYPYYRRRRSFNNHVGCYNNRRDSPSVANLSPIRKATAAISPQQY